MLCRLATTYDACSCGRGGRRCGALSTHHLLGFLCRHLECHAVLGEHEPPIYNDGGGTIFDPRRAVLLTRLKAHAMSLEPWMCHCFQNIGMPARVQATAGVLLCQ